MTSPTDYTTYFEYPVPTKIHGEPQFESLQTLKDQLKTNSQTVVSDLGGGAHGHLGLVLPADEYALVSPVPYAFPVHPGALHIPAGTAQHEAIRLRDEHKERIRVYREALGVQQALLKQIVAAVDEEYLKELRNEHTNAITLTIPEILSHLTTTYGQVDSSDLRKQEEQLTLFHWNVNDPPAEMYNLVENLVKASIAAGMPKTQEQIIAFGLEIIKKTADFEVAMGAWYDRPPAEKTWVNFKTHFSQAHRKLKKVRGTTMRNTTFHQVNQLAEQINNDFAHLESDVLTSINEWSVARKTPDPPLMAPAPDRSEQLATMNATIATNTEMLRLMQQLQQQLKNMQATSPPFPTQPTPSRNGRGSLRPRRNTSKYCWTHGACSHESSDCNAKAQGHQDSATFNNKMGGSTYYCQPVTDA